MQKYKDPVSAFNDSDDELFQSIDTTTTSSGRGSHGSHGTTPGGSRRRSVTKQQGVVESPSKVSLSGGGQTNGNILYVAPIGKAAAVMRKRSQQNAYTIHQVIFSFRNWTNKDSNKGPWKFTDTQIVAVDEVSMVSLEVRHNQCETSGLIFSQITVTFFPVIFSSVELFGEKQQIDENCTPG